MKHLKTQTEHINESVTNQKTLDQLHKIRKMTKGIDIGDRISKDLYPNQLDMHNVSDVHIQTHSEYMDEPFEVNQNVKNFKTKK